MLSDEIRGLAGSLGIDAIGFAEARPFSDYALTQSRRANPKRSLPNAKTIIVAGIYIGGLTIPLWKDPQYGRTSRLYLSGFFLDVVKPLEPIAELLRREGFQSVICDDSKNKGSVLPLKRAAVRAGLGWQGKHSLLISRKYGTFLALGGIITDAVLDYNTEEESGRCKKCGECQKSCPLGALDRPYTLNRNRCLSHLLQVEPLPEEARDIMDNRIGDCEICQEACPWNRKHLSNPLPTEMTRNFQHEIKAWGDFFHLPYLAGLSKSEYIERMGHLNTDIPYRLFRRNVLAAMRNIERDA